MKFTLSWLKDHLDSDASLEAIVEKLSMIGLEVDGVEDRAKELAAFKVAHVIEAVQHPNADRLRVCRVDTGEGEVQVVCGAPNARTGMYGIFAPAGSYIPGTDMVLKPGKIRGEESNGMLVSEREMGLSDEHDGIIELEEPAPIGTPMAAVLGLDDPVIEIAITPNRGDCLGVRGIARDLAAAGLGRLKPFNPPKVEGTFDSPIAWRRDLPAEEGGLCPYVAGRYFRNVKNGPSPAWMQQRLTAVGLRPISALVDITNYVMLDLNRPLHVFDADKVKGDVTMRLARAGEEILALDGVTYPLDEEMVVIADDQGPEGIGGVMGGEISGVSEETTNVFLEVALFDPVRVAVTGRKLGLHSDARYRFERGLDPQSADWGVDVAASYVAELCGGEASHAVSAGTIPAFERPIEFDTARVESLGGVSVEPKDQRRILEDLGFELEAGEDRFTAHVPSWRPDVEGPACLVEEVMRIHGFEHIPLTMEARGEDLPHGVLTADQKREGHARRALVWRGMLECTTFSFIAPDLAALFGGDKDSLTLVNPISADLAVMRPSILPSLASAAARNADRGFGDIAFFEVGPLYRDDSPEGQAQVAAGLRCGAPNEKFWGENARDLDAYDAKADALAVLAACEAPVENLQIDGEAAPAWYHPGRSGGFRLGPKVLGCFGELHPKILRALDMKGPVVAFEIDLALLPKPRAKKGALKAAPKLSAFQPVHRDFAFLLDADVPADSLLRAARGADKGLISQVRLFDHYAGKGIEPGKKSLAITVTLQPTEKTLTDAEIEAVAAKVISQVAKATGGTLRG